MILNIFCFRKPYQTKCIQLIFTWGLLNGMIIIFNYWNLKSIFDYWYFDREIKTWIRCEVHKFWDLSSFRHIIDYIICIRCTSFILCIYLELVPYLLKKNQYNIHTFWYFLRKPTVSHLSISFCSSKRSRPIFWQVYK